MALFDEAERVTSTPRCFFDYFRKVDIQGIGDTEQDIQRRVRPNDASPIKCRSQALRKWNAGWILIEVNLEYPRTAFSRTR